MLSLPLGMPRLLGSLEIGEEKTSLGGGMGERPREDQLSMTFTG